MGELVRVPFRRFDMEKVIEAIEGEYSNTVFHEGTRISILDDSGDSFSLDLPAVEAWSNFTLEADLFLTRSITIKDGVWWALPTEEQEEQAQRDPISGLWCPEHRQEDPEVPIGTVATSRPGDEP